MRRPVTILSALCICVAMAADALAQHTYAWTISASATDPLVNTGALPPGLVTLHLWFYCSDAGMSAAEIDPVISAGNTILAFNVANGYLNAGNATHLLLAVGGCPSAPVNAGNWLILKATPVDLCPGGANVTVDCSPDPSAWPNHFRGFSELGVPCEDSMPEDPCEGPYSVESTSWGRVKQLYRE
jgi:hypothetical protein